MTTLNTIIEEVNTPDKRVEEIVKKFENEIISVDELGHEAHISDAYSAVQWLRTTLTQHHQDMIKEDIAVLEGAILEPGNDEWKLGFNAAQKQFISYKKDQLTK